MVGSPAKAVLLSSPLKGSVLGIQEACKHDAFPWVNP